MAQFGNKILPFYGGIRQEGVGAEKRAASITKRYVVTANPPKLAKICQVGTPPTAMRVIIAVGPSAERG